MSKGPIFAQILINEVCASNSTTISDHEDEYADWIEIFNAGNEPVDLKDYCLSDDHSDLLRWRFPQYTLQPGSYLLLFASGKDINTPPSFSGLENILFHTNFRLDANGEPLYLTNPEGAVVDSLIIDWQAKDHSFGRLPDGLPEWHLFGTPTPGEPNHTKAYIDYLYEKPQFSKPGGRFQDSFHLSLSSANPEDSIYYTIDGSDPDSTSSLYVVPIYIAESHVVKAVILKEGYLPVRPAVHSYIPGNHAGLPVISISTDPVNLWDQDYGIYAMGPNASSTVPHFGANFWNDWERPVHVEIYDETDSLVLNIGAGVKIFGGRSRSHPQKSLSLFSRKEYGDSKIDHQLFPGIPIYDFEAIVLRNSGNDWFGAGFETGTMFRDVMMTSLMAHMDVEYQKGRQAVLYINGEYFGIHNIREKVNEHFLESNTGVDSDRVELLTNNQEVIIGSNDHYKNLYNFVSTKSLQSQENYEYVRQRMDIHNFIQYQLAQIYFNNTDWPGNNIKYWRPDYENGRWRWIIFDTDFGFGMYGKERVWSNTLHFALAPDRTRWPNPAWSTLLLRKLIANSTFRDQFINSFADQINTTFQKSSVDLLIDELAGNISDEMIHHSERWGGSYQNWVNKINDLKYFSQHRQAIVQDHIVSRFGLGGTHNVTLNVTQSGSGVVRLNTLMLRSFPWTGVYFQGVPVVITALPEQGYKFSHWSGSINSTEPHLQVHLDAAFTITAHFMEDPEYDRIDYVKVNEISYSSDAVYPTRDWIELVNRTDQYIDISEWSVRDKNDAHNYVINEGTVLKPYGFYVICRDKYSFRAVHVDVEDFEGNFDFGLSSNGDRVRLYNGDRELMSVVPYEVDAPWPVTQKGSGYTLSLISPDRNGLLADSWAVSEQKSGTPGRDNFEIIAGEEKMETIGYEMTLRNYPNPFTYTTTIEFYSDRYQHVLLTVFELNGRAVDVLVDETYPAGHHTFNWSPSIPSGIYILRLETPQDVQIRRMIRIE